MAHIKDEGEVVVAKAAAVEVGAMTLAKRCVAMLSVVRHIAGGRWCVCRGGRGGSRRLTAIAAAAGNRWVAGSRRNRRRRGTRCRAKQACAADEAHAGAAVRRNRHGEVRGRQLAVRRRGLWQRPLRQRHSA